MAELLFEIGTEELPPGLITSLTNQIKENIKNELSTNNILTNSNETKTFNTPRRIAIYIPGLPKSGEVRCNRNCRFFTAYIGDLFQIGNPVKMPVDIDPGHEKKDR